MSRVVAGAALALLTLASAVAVAAPGFVPATDLGTSVLDLDVADGRFSEWHFAAGSLRAVKARAQVLRLGQDQRFAPAFTILLTNDKKRAALQLLADSRKPPLTASLMLIENGKRLEHVTFAKTVALGEAVDVALDWTGDGKITATLGGETKTIALGGAVKDVAVTASTVEVKLDPLQIGRVK